MVSLSELGIICYVKLCTVGVVRAYFFFGTTFDFDFSQTPESKVESGVFNPLLAAIQTPASHKNFKLYTDKRKTV